MVQIHTHTVITPVWVAHSYTSSIPTPRRLQHLNEFSCKGTVKTASLPDTCLLHWRVLLVGYRVQCALHEGNVAQMLFETWTRLWCPLRNSHSEHILSGFLEYLQLRSRKKMNEVWRNYDMRSGQGLKVVTEVLVPQWTRQSLYWKFTRKFTFKLHPKCTS